MVIGRSYEDERADFNMFKLIADSKVTEEVNDQDCEIFRKIINKCLMRYTKRPTAHEVSQSIHFYLIIIDTGFEHVGLKVSHY